MSRDDYSPPGFKLVQTLPGYKHVINRIAWSPDGNVLAIPFKFYPILLYNLSNPQFPLPLKGKYSRVHCVTWSPDGHILASSSDTASILLWDTDSGNLIGTFKGHSNYVRSIEWLPDGQTLVSGDLDGNILVWNLKSKEVSQKLTKQAGSINGLALAPDGKTLASGCADDSIMLHDLCAGKLLETLRGHYSAVNNVIWMPDGQTIVSCSNDHTIRLWDAMTGRQKRILEDHTAPIVCISLSSNGQFLASKSRDGTVRLWRSDSWQRVSILNESNSERAAEPSLAFHPKSPILATLGKGDTVVRIWYLDVPNILSSAPVTPSVYYSNAKVVLVGDAGVGKSGLGLVLTGQPFVPTDSTHARHIWTFDSQEVDLNDNVKEIREILLWDLAGQPAYRLIHQLHLHEVAIALILFDAHNETDPFSGVHHWSKSMRQAQQLRGSSGLPLKKFLVAARQDRGGREASRKRVDSLIQELGFDGYFETSAKEGWQVEELAQAIRNSLIWDAMPKVSSTNLFQRIKNFLIAEKEHGKRILSTVEDLYRTFVTLEKIDVRLNDLRAEFVTCIGLVESRDLIRQFSFGKLVLLQPEMLDVYASALINAVKDEPDGLGCISEEKAQRGSFFVTTEERLKNQDQENLLLIAVVEDLLRYEIALREYAEDGPYLVFPSQSMRENPDLPDPEGKSVIFRFDGPVSNIYTSLAVRLSHSGLFKKNEFWRNAVTYTASTDGTYGILLRNLGEGRGELTLFFDKLATEDTCLHFEEYVQMHLQRKALPDSIQRQRVYSCSTCGTLFTHTQVLRRQELGFNWMVCSVCDSKVELTDRMKYPKSSSISFVSGMDRAADMKREREASASILQGKRKIGYFDVFLCHNKDEKSAVKGIGNKLLEFGILPWLDEWELQPGLPWQPSLERQIGRIKSVAVFIGDPAPN